MFFLKCMGLCTEMNIGSLSWDFIDIDLMEFSQKNPRYLRKLLRVGLRFFEEQNVRMATGNREECPLSAYPSP